MLSVEFWSNYFKVYDVLNFVPTYTELLDHICLELQPRPGNLVLDVGSGTGNLALRLKERGCNVIALDFCRQALERHVAKDSDCCVLLADLAKALPFRDNTFDAIASNNVLYAMPAHQQLMVAKELHRVLKPGGRIVLANPKAGWKPLPVFRRAIELNIQAEGGWVTAKKIVEGISPTIKMFYYNWKLARQNDYHYFELHEQRALLEASGFSPVSDTKLVYADQVVLNSAFK